MKEQQAEVSMATKDPQGVPGTGTALAGKGSVLDYDADRRHEGGP